MMRGFIPDLPNGIDLPLDPFGDDDLDFNLASYASTPIRQAKPIKTKSGLSYDEDGLIKAKSETVSKKSSATPATIPKHLTEDTCCSFNEWSDSGYIVKKGEKSYFRDCLNIPQFTVEQVVKKKKY